MSDQYLMIQPGLFGPDPGSGDPPPASALRPATADICAQVSGLSLFATPPPPLTIGSVLPGLLRQHLFEFVRDAGKRWALRRAAGLSDEQLRDVLACEMRESVYFEQWYIARFHARDLGLTISPRVGVRAPFALRRSTEQLQV